MGDPTEYTATSLDDVARFFHVDRRMVMEWRKDGLPGETRNYNLSEIVRWLRKEGPWKRHSKASDRPSNGQPTVAQRRENIKLAMEEAALLEKQSELVPRAEVHEWLTGIANTIRAACEAARRQHGEEVLAPVLDAFDALEHRLAEGTLDSSGIGPGSDSSDVSGGGR